jgi:hypothetical protein
MMGGDVGGGLWWEVREASLGEMPRSDWPLLDDDIQGEPGGSAYLAESWPVRRAELGRDWKAVNIYYLFCRLYEPLPLFFCARL